MQLSKPTRTQAAAAAVGTAGIATALYFAKHRFSQKWPSLIRYSFTQNSTEGGVIFDRVPDDAEVAYECYDWLRLPGASTQEIKSKCTAEEEIQFSRRFTFELILSYDPNTNKLSFNTKDGTYNGFNPVPFTDDWYKNPSFAPDVYTFSSVEFDGNNFGVTIAFVDLC